MTPIQSTPKPFGGLPTKNTSGEPGCFDSSYDCRGYGVSAGTFFAARNPCECKVASIRARFHQTRRTVNNWLGSTVIRVFQILVISTLLMAVLEVAKPYGRIDKMVDLQGLPDLLKTRRTSVIMDKFNTSLQPLHWLFRRPCFKLISELCICTERNKQRPFLV